MDKNVLPEQVFGLPPEKGRWGFLLLGLMINICLGAVYAYSVFKEPLRVEFGFSATQGNLPFMLFIAIFSVGTFFSGRFIDQHGPRPVMIIGSVLVGMGWMLAKYATGLGSLVLAYSLIGGIGVGIVYGGPVAVAARWFPDKKGLAVGIALGGFGMSAFVTAPIARHLIAHPAAGVHNTFFLMGAGFLVLCVALSSRMRFPAPDWSPAGWLPPIGGGNAVLPSLSRRAMLRTPGFWALWICFTLGTTAGLMAIGVSAPVGSEIVHLDPAMAAMLVSVFAVFNGIGRPLFGWLADRICPRRAALLSFAIILLASIGMLQVGPGQTLLYTACFCGFWLCLGGWLAIAPATTAAYFGMKGYAQKYGLVFLAYGLGAILGGIVSGMAKDTFGSYTAAFTPTAAMGLLGLLVAGLFLRPPPATARPD
jgi:MFS transporter, OFA family, oxalate/formate antiporter